MRFGVRVLEPDEFDAWLADEESRAVESNVAGVTGGDTTEGDG
jgi:heme/copper-type cytochrome/quinol oxidase subunit 2